MASLEEPCLQIIRKILFCKCPNTCPPQISSTFKFAWFSSTSNSEIFNLQLPRTQRKRWRWRKRQKTRHQQAPSTGGRKHATGRHQGAPSSTGGRKHATRRHWKQKTCWRQEARRQGMSDTAPGASDTAQGGEWYGAGGRVTRHRGAWNLTPSPAAPRWKLKL